MDFSIALLCLGMFLLGSIVGSVATMSMVFPAVGRVVLRVLAVVALGLGTTLAIWPTVCLIRGERMRPINLPLPSSSIAEAGESFGWSGCLLVIGGLSLGFSFLGKAQKPVEKVPEEKKPEPLPIPPSQVPAE